MSTAKGTTKSDKKQQWSIYDLYQREKLITITDSDERSVDILLVKMTQIESQLARDEYEKSLGKDLKNASNGKIELIKKRLTPLTKEQMVEGVLNYEQVKREEIIDIYPFPEDDKEDSKELSEEEKQEALIVKWREGRKKDLIEKSEQELLNQLVDITIERTAEMNGLARFNMASLVHMCRHPKTKQKLFNTIEDVEKVLDSRVIEGLLTELIRFRMFEFEKTKKEVAKSTDFLPNGQSQEK